mmetsp:Transcript_16957/g.45662  ORF Transcript_16957/g.45662 Transcript_16957/m.45662 type:complete len:144 (-) Transcript_16957:433-864(-)|eukprot:CAMPEP_0185172908 /NCGR_PEP_ID=MMETSP1139-20130426/22386_1 /TAXON_ID=298111 /ORGANISM="Pavlova sp., Strain CCMP459" /LENGTH=143 /DNA_ID=CAMNT_0027738573 /DNA_START=35 /DNA_END=466 /DNA_ORIENTATION=+
MSVGLGNTNIFVPKESEENKELHELPPEVVAKVKELFDKMDENHDGVVSLKEAEHYWSAGKLGKFGTMSARAMFSEVDDDGNMNISFDEWVDFWKNVRNNPMHTYSDEEISEELQAMLDGEAWRDWEDGRSTTIDAQGLHTPH